MGIWDNVGGGGEGGGSGGRSGAREKGGIWCGFIVEGDVSIGIVVAMSEIHVVSFFSVIVFVFINIFAFSGASTSNIFSPKTKNRVTQWWRKLLMNLYYM